MTQLMTPKNNLSNSLRHSHNFVIDNFGRNNPYGPVKKSLQLSPEQFQKGLEPAIR